MKSPWNPIKFKSPFIMVQSKFHDGSMVQDLSPILWPHQPIMILQDLQPTGPLTYHIIPNFIPWYPNFFPFYHHNLTAIPVYPLTFSHCLSHIPYLLDRNQWPLICLSHEISDLMLDDVGWLPPSRSSNWSPMWSQSSSESSPGAQTSCCPRWGSSPWAPRWVGYWAGTCGFP